MLEKIVKELKDVENEAELIIRKTQKEAQKMIDDEKKRQKEIKEKIISDYHKKGQELVEERIKKANEKAKQIYDNSKIEIENIKNDIKNKFDQAVEMVLKQMVK